MSSHMQFFIYKTKQRSKKNSLYPKHSCHLGTWACHTPAALQLYNYQGTTTAGISRSSCKAAQNWSKAKTQLQYRWVTDTTEPFSHVSSPLLITPQALSLGSTHVQGKWQPIFLIPTQFAQVSTGHTLCNQDSPLRVGSFSAASGFKLSVSNLTCNFQATSPFRFSSIFFPLKNTWFSIPGLFKTSTALWRASLGLSNPPAKCYTTFYIKRQCQSKGIYKFR